MTAVAVAAVVLGARGAVLVGFAGFVALTMVVVGLAGLAALPVVVVAGAAFAATVFAIGAAVTVMIVSAVRLARSGTVLQLALLPGRALRVRGAGRPAGFRLLLLAEASLRLCLTFEARSAIGIGRASDGGLGLSGPILLGPTGAPREDA